MSGLLCAENGSRTIGRLSLKCFAYYRNMDDYFLEQKLAAMAAAIADPSRARMLCLLMDGRAYTATELTAVADVASSTASKHLSRLAEQQLVHCIQQGRHRYFRLANAEVAAMLESLMGLVVGARPLVVSKTPPSLRFARTCYDHMAGEMAVALHQRLLAMAWLDPSSTALTGTGRQHLTALGVNCQPPDARRRFAGTCLDWSERQFHLGGWLGCALLQAFEASAWVRRELDSRQLQLTASGQQALSRHFGLALSAMPLGLRATNPVPNKVARR
ncbi:ArsR family transcriptional regulator [Neisseriaceae bacterium TC5R-5]|nr:ArsR family transcriptional regulator [Neisseriaceae bacterium TC5R-5]